MSQRPILKSAKLANVLYDVRGPIVDAAKQMEDYAKDVRQDPVMTQVARWLDDRDRRAVSQYYASMPVPAAPAVASGPTPAIYMQGAPGRGIHACASASAWRVYYKALEPCRRD